MATKKKMLQAAAGNAGGAGLDVEEVFSTYLYTGDSTNSRQITNGIDLSGEGGMVITAPRSNGNFWSVADSERGATSFVYTNATYAEQTNQERYGTFNSDGYTLGSSSGNSYINYTGYTYASWTFRKAPKFFDVVTYTGDGTQGRTVSHNLGSVPGMIIVKSINRAQDWAVYHRGNTSGGDAEDWYLLLNQTSGAFDSNTHFADTAPTSTEFTVGTNARVNENTRDFVAYLFAHNDGDGEFGPSGDQDIIKCGSYTGTGSSQLTVDLGFEPQWLLVKRTDTANDWILHDTMRGFGASGNFTSWLEPNTSDAEATATADWLELTSTGFSSTSTQSRVNASGGNYIYIAIRRGTKVPESGTEVFDIQFNGGNDPSKAPIYQSGFVTDMAIVGYRTGGSVNYPYTGNRLMGIQTLETHNTDAEEPGGTSFQWDFMNGFIDGVPSVITDTQIAWMWKRAPNYMDCVAYTGNGTAGRTVSHNLGVAPEMMWVKRRDNTDIWVVYNETVGNTGFLRLNDTNAVTTATVAWNDTSPTATDFTLGTYAAVNTSSSTYIAYLFASLPGISKVGSYTGNGTNQTIDCGFTSGARFILVKRTDSTGDWYVWDTERGIVAGNDPYLELNTTDAEVTSTDWVDPDNSGFIVNGTTINASSASYIFYAIA